VTAASTTSCNGPAKRPRRTAFFAAVITFYVVLFVAGGNDIVATQFHVSLNDVTYALRVGYIVLPVIAYVVTRRVCLGLQRQDDERMPTATKRASSSGNPMDSSERSWHR
jgi:ubiquinol-cytochrome c reductase cytochrome b subunit